MGCSGSKEKKDVNKKTNSKLAESKELVKTVAPSTAFEIPLDDEKAQGIKKLPPLSSQKHHDKPTISPNQVKNQREKELNSKMDQAEKNKQALLQKKKEKGKERDEKVRQVRERKNSLSGSKQLGNSQ